MPISPSGLGTWFIYKFQDENAMKGGEFELLLETVVAAYEH